MFLDLYLNVPLSRENLCSEEEDIDMTFVEEFNDNLASNTTEAKAKISLITADLAKTAVKKLKPDKCLVTRLIYKYVTAN